MKRNLIVILSMFFIIILQACTPQEIDESNEKLQTNQEFDTGDSGNPTDDDKDSTLVNNHGTID